MLRAGGRAPRTHLWEGLGHSLVCFLQGAPPTGLLCPFLPVPAWSPCLLLPSAPSAPSAPWNPGAGAELEAGRADTVAKSPSPLGWPTLGDRGVLGVREVSPTPAPGGWEGMWGLTPSLVSIFPWGDGGVPGPPAQRRVGSDCTPGSAYSAPSPHLCDRRSWGDFSPSLGPAQAGARSGAHLRPASASR